METDSEDPIVLLQVTCKALLDLDISTPYLVNCTEAMNNDDSDQEDEEITSMTDIFFHVVQFLNLATHGTIKNPVIIDMLTTSHPCEWAITVTTQNGVAIHGGPNTNDDVTALRLANLGATLNRVADTMQTNTVLLVNKVEKDVKKSKT